MKNRYYISKNIGYQLIDKKTDEKIAFEMKETEWRKAFNEMVKYIKENKIKLKEIYLTSSLSDYDKKSLIGKIK